MKHNKKDWKLIYNDIFEDNNKSIRIIDYAVSKSRNNGRHGKPSGYVLFNNGYKITDGKIVTLHGRMKKQKMINLVDELYSKIDIVRENVEKNILKEKCSRGGFVNWEKNRHQIISKLKGRSTWNKGLTKKCDCRVKSAWNKGLTKEMDERVKQMGESRVGSKNPMYGFERTDEHRDKQSKTMKELILDGKFTPQIRNSRTHWQCNMDGKKYRSSWEALFHHLNPSFEYEKLRIKYDFNDKKNIYIVDFIDVKNKTVCEVKPKRQQYDEKNKSKYESLKKWSLVNKYKLIIVDEEYICDNYKKIDRSKFDDHSLELLEVVYSNENKKNRENRETEKGL